ncbi:hypothetical protein SALB1_0432 [Salinisphaera sp. LB1]|nr:hypothetical protein SALB1_0432 [Salinisphaera sp. LB1]
MMAAWAVGALARPARRQPNHPVAFAAQGQSPGRGRRARCRADVSGGRGRRRRCARLGLDQRLSIST